MYLGGREILWPQQRQPGQGSDDIRCGKPTSGETSTYGGVAYSDRVSPSNMMTFRFSLYYAVELVVGHLRNHRWWRAE